MTQIDHAAVIRPIRQLLNQVFSNDAMTRPGVDVQLDVSRGYDRKGSRTSREINQAHPDDTVVLELSMTTGDNVIPVRNKGIFLPDYEGQSGVNIRIELGSDEPIAQVLLRTAELTQHHRKLAEINELESQRCEIQNKINALATGTRQEKNSIDQPTRDFAHFTDTELADDLAVVATRLKRLERSTSRNGMVAAAVCAARLRRLEEEVRIRNLPTNEQPTGEHHG